MAEAQVDVIPLIGERWDLVPARLEELRDPVHFIVTPRHNPLKAVILEVKPCAGLVRHKGRDRFQKVPGFAVHDVVKDPALLIPITYLFPSLVIPSEKVAFCRQGKVWAEGKDL